MSTRLSAGKVRKGGRATVSDRFLGGQLLFGDIDVGGLRRIYSVQQSHVVTDVIAQDDHRQRLGQRTTGGSDNHAVLDAGAVQCLAKHGKSTAELGYNLDRFLTEIKPDLDEIEEKARRGSEVGVPAS